MTDDFARFEIDPDQPRPDVALDLARYLESQGVPIDEIRSLNGFDELNTRVWRLHYGLDGPPLTIDEAAAAAGMDAAHARRVLRAFGFADTDERIVLTEDDVDVLRLVKDFSGLVGEDVVLQLTRIMGGSLGRLAEAISDLVRVNLEAPTRDEMPLSESLPLLGMITRGGLPRFAHAMDRLLRYHIMRVSGQDWDIEVGGKATFTRATVGFADMVGFTAQSGELSTNELAHVIDRFEGRVSEIITSLGGRVIKFIGDEVMFLFADSSAACRCACDLQALPAGDEAIPDVRIGLARGDVMTRYGDCYGPVVNRAKRLVESAAPGTILVTPEVASSSGDGFTFEGREPVRVKGIDEPVEHFLLT